MVQDLFWVRVPGSPRGFWNFLRDQGFFRLNVGESGQREVKKMLSEPFP